MTIGHVTTASTPPGPLTVEILLFMQIQEPLQLGRVLRPPYVGRCNPMPLEICMIQ